MSAGPTLALAGNQNCGKTTLFNRLTGANQQVGNWPGVTVERRSGTLAGGAATLVDLPGTYSLVPYTPEERVTRDYLLSGEADVIVDCVDATHLERNLYLTLQLLSLRRPLVVALNMMDSARGLRIDASALEKALGAPVVPISARRGDGVEALARAATQAAGAPTPEPVFDGAIAEALRATRRLTDGRAEACGLPSEYAAIGLLEGDEHARTRLGLSASAAEAVEQIAARLERESGMERAAAFADARYRHLEGMLARCVSGRSRERGERLDALLLHSAAAYPTFAAAMLGMLWLAFGPVGGALAEAFAGVVDGGIALLSAALLRWRAAPWLRELLCEGALRGVGSVLKFLPTLCVLFLLLSLLESSGYLARAAFLTDRPLRRLGLSGRAFIPLLLGFGCTVPAAMSARSLGPGERRRTVLLLPFMSCGAKTPVYALLARAFFPGRAVAVTAALYAGGLLVGACAARGLKRFGSAPEPFLLELPPYRLPSPGNALRQLWERVSDFLRRAFTVVFLATLGVWFLGRFTPTLTRAAALSESLLGGLAGALAPLLTPAGFGDARAAAALLTGWLAKESVVSTLDVLASDGLAAVFPTPLSAAAFLAFTLLYAPCAAACAAMRRELESGRLALLSALVQTALAWLVATGIYQLGRLLGF